MLVGVMLVRRLGVAVPHLWEPPDVLDRVLPEERDAWEKGFVINIIIIIMIIMISSSSSSIVSMIVIITISLIIRRFKWVPLEGVATNTSQNFCSTQRTQFWCMLRLFLEMFPEVGGLVCLT